MAKDSVQLSERGALRAVAAVGVATLGVAGVVGLVGAADVAPIGVLLTDPSAYTDQPWYLGAMSSVSIIGWWTAVVLFALAALVDRRVDRPVAAMAGGAGLSALLWADDLFLLHEEILGEAIGSEKPVLAFYALAVPAWLWSIRDSLSPAVRMLVVASVGALGLSVLLDLAGESTGTMRALGEDAFKFAGAWLWATFAGASLFERAMPVVEARADKKTLA